jgi:hypothetical protein
VDLNDLWQLALDMIGQGLAGNLDAGNKVNQFYKIKTVIYKCIFGDFFKLWDISQKIFELRYYCMWENACLEIDSTLWRLYLIVAMQANSRFYSDPWFSWDCVIITVHVSYTLPVMQNKMPTNVHMSYEPHMCQYCKWYLDSKQLCGQSHHSYDGSLTLLYNNHCT